MAYRRDRERRPEEPRGEQDEQRTEPAPAERLLALQRSAGNRAVTALLARAPDAAKPKEKEKTPATGPRATLPDIGTIPLLSVSFGGSSRPGGEGREGNAPRELVLSSALGEHSPKLMRASIDGKAMAVDVILPGGRLLKLEGAVVSGYSTSGDGRDAIESWTLNFVSIEHASEAEPGE